jgi:hypothetical protein
MMKESLSVLAAGGIGFDESLLDIPLLLCNGIENRYIGHKIQVCC